MPTPAELAARTVAGEGVSSPGLIGDIEAFLGLGATDSITAAVPVVTEAGAVTAEAAGASVAGIGLWPVVLILLIVLCTLRVLENIIIYPFGLIPFAGGKVQNAVKVAFRWLDNFENMVIAYCLKAIGRLVSDVLTLFTFLLGIVLPRLLPAPQMPAANSTGYATEREIHFLQSEINTLKQAVGTIQYVTTDKTVTVGVPQTVWDQIHHLEGQMHAVQTSITDLYSRTDRLTNIATQIQTEFRSLTGEIHAVRAVSAGWQDIQQELENLGSLTTQFIDETSAELGKVVSVQTQMLPLTLLLEPGIKGLRNLRKLEDNICQCPKFANIPNELGTALAVLEFVENG